MDLNGVLLIDKPSGPTSHDVVAAVRRTLGIRRVGHAGTLDPEATGLLVLCVGPATRLLEYMVVDEKTYEGTVTFGIGTTTDDAVGEVVAQQSAADLTAAQVVAEAGRMVGQLEQRVPAYSAVHINGRRAYDLARRNETFETPVRNVHIRSFDVWGFEPGETATAQFRVACSKGTYIRALCRDLGGRMALPAHLSRLRRVVAGRFRVEEAVPLADWQAAADPTLFLLPTTIAVRGMPQWVLPTDEIEQLAMGQVVLRTQAEPLDGVAAVCDASGRLAAVVECMPAASGGVQLKPKKVLWKREP